MTMECLPLRTWMLRADTYRHTWPNSQRFLAPEICISQSSLLERVAISSAWIKQRSRDRSTPSRASSNSSTIWRFGTHISRKLVVAVDLEFVDKSRRANRIIPIKDEHSLWCSLITKPHDLLFGLRLALFMAVWKRVSQWLCGYGFFRRNQKKRESEMNKQWCEFGGKSARPKILRWTRNWPRLADLAEIT